MTNDKHTPDYGEPWEGFHDYEGETLIRVASAGGVAGSVLFTENRRARAVACVNACKRIDPDAVPDLLAALEMVTKTADTGHETGHTEAEVVAGNWDVIGPVVRAALAKARGSA